MSFLSGIVETTKALMDEVEATGLQGAEKKEIVINTIMDIYNVKGIPDVIEKTLYRFVFNLIETLWKKFFNKGVVTATA